MILSRWLTLGFVLSAMACQSVKSGPQRPTFTGSKSPGPIVDAEQPNEIAHQSQGSAQSNPANAGSIPNNGTTPPVGTTGGTQAAADGKASTAGLTMFGDSLDTNPNLPFGILTLDSNDDSVLLSRPEYVLSWNSKTMNINWAAWILNLDHLVNQGRASRSFSPDPLLTDYLKAKGLAPIYQSDYTNSCFDRGHQVASADRQKDESENLATYLTTNIVPQTAFLNQIVWGNFEDKIRKWVADGTYPNLWIVAGPLYGSTLHFTGKKSNIAIPESNFKAVYAYDGKSGSPKLIEAVIMPNVTSEGKDPATDHDALCGEATGGESQGSKGSLSTADKDYIVPLSTIESLGHLHFPAAVH